MIHLIIFALGALSALCLVGFAREHFTCRQHTRALCLSGYAARLRAANAARDIAQARASEATADAAKARAEAARAADALAITQHAQQRAERARQEMVQRCDAMGAELREARAERDALRRELGTPGRWGVVCVEGWRTKGGVA